MWEWGRPTTPQPDQTPCARRLTGEDVLLVGPHYLWPLIDLYNDILWWKFHSRESISLILQYIICVRVAQTIKWKFNFQNPLFRLSSRRFPKFAFFEILNACATLARWTHACDQQAVRSVRCVLHECGAFQIPAVVLSQNHGWVQRSAITFRVSDYLFGSAITFVQRYV